MGDTILDIASQRGTRALTKEQTLIQNRLDRELASDDQQGDVLRAAVDRFWAGLHAGADQEQQNELAGAVYNAVRNVQSARWRRIEAKYGKVSHYFDPYGQVKARYRHAGGTKRDKGRAAGSSGLRRPFLALLLLAAAVLAWRWLR